VLADELPALRLSPSLKDLPPQDFEHIYDCDRFTATVLVNKFDYVIKHMVSQVMRTAFSPIVRDSADLAATLNGPASASFGVIAVSNTLPLFLGSMTDGVRISLEEYGLSELKSGDVIMVNDYYRVGTHVNDVMFIRPLFSEGELLGAVTIRAHQMDMGGLRPGGFDVTKADVYEDGLVIPPMLLFDGGKPVRSLFALLMANTRFSELIAPDIHSIQAALELGARLVDDAIRRYGVAAYLGAMRYAADASAEAMRTALAKIPDGVYEAEEKVDGDTLSDQEYLVRLRLIKRGSRAEFDFSGSSLASPDSLNCSWADSKSAVAIALKCLIDRHSRYTSGSLRDVDILLPPGAFNNPSPPHSCMYYHEVVLPMMYATFKALNPVLGPAAIGAESPNFTFLPTGKRADGRAWATFSVGIGSNEGDGGNDGLGKEAPA
jgi:N-methylhydantoinase B